VFGEEGDRHVQSVRRPYEFSKVISAIRVDVVAEYTPVDAHDRPAN
jgi:hypothetical protein